MDKVIENLIAKELDRASKIYGDNFSSAHEGESVINEEIQEVEEDVDKIINGHLELWQAVRLRDEEYASKNIQRIRDYTVSAISELIQVAAMCDKYQNSLGNEYVWEICPHCEEEVPLLAKLEKQTCPACNYEILPCSMCEICKNPCPLEVGK